jgi:ParB family chromosome partitioning protein
MGGISPAPPQSAADANVPAAAPADSGPASGVRIQRVSLGQIRPSPFQPRKTFSQESLQELADSIREQGIIQPLIVRPRDDHFELIAGERRFRAAQMLELADVPVIVRQADDRDVLELALIENLQRDNLNPLEEALGYSQLISQFDLRQEDVAARVGRNRASVANALRLLKLPEEVR